MKKLIYLMMIFSLFLGMAPVTITSAQVAPLWEQLPNSTNDVSSAIDHQLMADDFLLAETSSISQIEMWNRIAGPVDVYFNIYANTIDADNYNIPGELLNSYLITSTGIEEDGSICSDISCSYRHTLNLDLPLELASGHYWLSVYGLAGSYFGWSFADIPSELTTHAFKYATSDTWNGRYSGALAFRLLEPQLDILPDSLPPATVGFPYSQQLTPVGGTSPYIWSSIGLIDTQFSLISDTGVLVSDVNPTAPGEIPFTAKWRDSNSVEVSKNYSLTVSSALTFSPDTLPATSKEGEAYSQVVTLSGGTAPYAITSASLPDWLSYILNPDTGTITLSGTPTSFGAFTVQLQAEDAIGVKGAKTFNSWINPQRAFTWSPESPSQFEGVTFTPLSNLGSNDMRWWRGDNPGDTCDTYVFTYVNTLYAEFNQSGSYQVCLQYRIDSIGDLVWDKQWVTIANVIPKDVYIRFDPETVYLGSSVSAGISFFDWDVGPFTCTIDWGDGSAQQTVPSDSYQQCNFPDHLYAEAGTYSVSGYVTEEGVGSTLPTTVSLEVLDPAFVPPVAWNGNWLVGESGPSRIRLEAFDKQGTEDLTFAIVDPPLHGTLGTPVFEACENREDGSGSRVCSALVDYTPETVEPLYNGSDSFTFTASDAGLTSEPGEIYVQVAPNSAPTAFGDSLTVVSTNSSTITLIATDPDVVSYISDKLDLEITNGPSLGTLGELVLDSYETNPSGATFYWRITYTPNGSPGTDSFEFQVTDNNYHTSTATINLTVQEPTTWHVNSFDDVDDGACDSNHCSLREAVFYAFSGDSIDFAGLSELPGTIVLGGEQIWINKDLTITGPGADQLAISGNQQSRVFSVSDYELPVNVTISGLTIKDGRGYQGGGVNVMEGSQLTMNDCVIGPNNIVTYAGGGIFNDSAILTLNRCTVIGNEGTGSLGGAGVTTAYWGASTTINNSTISGNITNNFGGGIYVGYGGSVSLVHTTVSGNISNANYAEFNEERGGGAGIFIDVEGEAQLQNSIVAGNNDMTDPVTAGHDKWPDVYGTVSSLGGNLIGDNTGSSGWVDSDQVGTAESKLDPLLGSLQLNGTSTTPTMALLEGSPAIDAAPTCEVTIDQRGIVRPQGASCDIGAYELEQAAATGELKISKVFDPSTSGFLGTFTIHYDCDDGIDHDGMVDLAAGASAAISGIPTGTTCTVTEPTLPTAPTGWTFGEPSFSTENGVVLVNDASPAYSEVVVTNTISRDLGELKISKVFDPLTSGFSGTFTINYDCEGESYDGFVELGAGESLTIAGLPTGMSCSVTESVLPIAPEGWAFGEPSYFPESGIVTITEGSSTLMMIQMAPIGAEVIVTNTITPAFGELKITKDFDPLDSGFTDLFTISYDCDDGTDHDGTIELAAGESITIGGIPTGTICNVTEPTLPTAPEGWVFTWPIYNTKNGAVVISEVSPAFAEVIVYNFITPALGELKITKAFDPLTSGFTGSFTINYDCDDGIDHDGTVFLAAGESATISGIPIGTNCAVVEGSLPTAPSGWTFGTPVYSPESGVVTIAEVSPSYAQVLVTNSISSNQVDVDSQFTMIDVPVSQFAGGTAPDLSDLQYTVEPRKKKQDLYINTVTPSTFIYYLKMILPAEESTIVLTQENDSGFPLLIPSVTLFDKDFASLNKKAAKVDIDDDGVIEIEVGKGDPDRILYIAIAYNTNSVLGTKANDTPDAIYSFKTVLNGVDLLFGDSLKLILK